VCGEVVTVLGVVAESAISRFSSDNLKLVEKFTIICDKCKKNLK
jgi:hypothetical protein